MTVSSPISSQESRINNSGIKNDHGDGNETNHGKRLER